MRVPAWSAMAALLLVAAGIALSPASARAAEAARVVAILPFDRLSTRADDEPLQAGFAETLTTALARVSGIQLIERGQLKRILDEIKIQNSGLVDPTAAVRIGQLSGAKQLVLGAFQRSGSVMRVTCRLVETETGAIDRQHAITQTAALAQDADLFTLQDAVCEALLKTFAVQPTPQEQTLITQVTNATSKRAAYDYYVQAREQYLLFTVEGYAQAVPLFEKALEADPKYALAMAGLAETLGMWGYQKKQNGEDPQADYQRALTMAKQAVATAPALGDAHRALAEACSHTSEIGTADRKLREREARKAVELNPQDAEGYVQLWGAVGEPLQGEGFAYIDKALEINPRLAAAWQELGTALQAHGKMNGAVAAYREAIAVNPRDANALNNLGIALRAQGKLDEAAAACRQAIAIRPRLAAAHINLGGVLQAQGKLDEAIAAYGEAIAIDPREATAYGGLGNALRAQAKPAEAAVAYRKAIELDPRLAAAHNGLGHALWDQGKRDEAVKAYREAIAVNPGYAPAHTSLGDALKAQGNLDEAIAAYRQAIAANPREAMAHLGLGTLFVLQGKRAEATVALQRFLELAREAPQLAESNSPLKPLIPKAEAVLKALGAR